MTNSQSASESDDDNALYSLRKRRLERAELEASVGMIWTGFLDQQTRTRLRHATDNIVEEYYSPGHTHQEIEELYQRVTRHLYEQLGIMQLPNPPPNALTVKRQRQSSRYEILRSISYVETPIDIIYSAIEGLWLTVSKVVQDAFQDKVRYILEDERIDHDFINGRFVPRSDQEMHAEVVIPTITLLSGRSDFEDAERNYMEALTSIREQRFDDAVTNAASAAEATLRILNCGDTQTPLAKRGTIATERNLLAPHDKGLLGWITATRGSEGDVHGQGSHTTRADAWLVVHVVGALILRLVDGPNRGLAR